LLPFVFVVVFAAAVPVVVAAVVHCQEHGLQANGFFRLH